MRNLPLCLIVLLVLGSALPACTSLGAEGRVPSEQIAAELQPYLRKSVQWNFPSLKRDIPLNIYYLDPSTTEPRESILYIKNRAWDRVGTENDLSILKDYLKEKFIVATLDLGDDPEATSPRIDDDINSIHRAFMGYMTPSILRAIKLEPTPNRCFIMPEGYRVAENLTYWQIDKNGSYGTMEWVMKTYNEEIVPHFKEHFPNAAPMKPAEKPSDMVDRNGNPLDYRIQMDILYPSESRQKVPAFIYSETEPDRDVHHHYLFQLRGYAYVVMGHCFNPCERPYWHMNQFTLDHWDGVKCYTAAIRYLNKFAGTYSIDPHHMGLMGISKGQQAVTSLSAPDNATRPEHETFSKFPADFGKFPPGSPEPQPWRGYPSTITCGWQGMGAGLWCKEFVTADYAPTILACGMHDRPVITGEGTSLLRSTLEKQHANFVYLPMDDLGHALSAGYDKTLGVDRYKLVNDFFDRYLKVKDKLPPVVLIATPRDGAENIDAAAAIWVQFAPVIGEKTILTGHAVKVTKLPEAQEVSGSWEASRHGTMFTFTPDKSLEKGTQYELSVTPGVTDKAGTHLQEVRTIHFKTAD